MFGFEAPKNSVSELKLKDGPTGRYGHRSVLYKDRFILYGGYNGQKRLSEVYEFNTITQLWKRIKTKGKKPGKRDCHSAVLYRNQMIVFGGGTGYLWRKDLFSYNIDTETWMELPQYGEIPVGRAGHSCVVHKDRMFLFGGWNGKRTMNDLYEYDFLTNTWREIHSEGVLKPKCRDSHCCVIHKGKMIVVGGGDGNHRLNDMYSYNIQKNIWDKIDYSGSGFVGRAGHYVGYYPSGDRLVMFGGGDGDIWIENLFEFDFKMNRWMIRDLSNCENTIPGCYGCSGVIYRNKLILFGGGDGRNFFDSLYQVEIEEEYQSKTQKVMFKGVLGRRKFCDCIVECNTY